MKRRVAEEGGARTGADHDDSKLNKRDFRQFLRDLRDLAQMAERRISSRRRTRTAALDAEELHDYATVGAYVLNREGKDREAWTAALRSRYPTLTDADLGRIYRYAREFYGRRVPNLDVQKSAQAYREKTGVGDPTRHPYVPVAPRVGAEIAQAFTALPNTPPDEASPEGRRSRVARMVLR
jgi:hypothetical protein